MCADLVPTHDGWIHYGAVLRPKHAEVGHNLGPFVIQLDGVIGVGFARSCSFAASVGFGYRRRWQSLARTVSFMRIVALVGIQIECYV